MNNSRFDIAAITASPVVRVWRNREFTLFMSGIGPYYITGWMQRVAVGWLAWELTKSPAWLGAVAAADLAPMLLIAPFAGAVVDRWDPIKQMKLAQVFIILQALLVAVLTLAGMMTIELLFVLSLVSGVVMPVFNAARQTIVPATVPRSDFPSAISLDSALFHGSRFIGPMIAGLTIQQFGVGETFVAHVLGSLFFTLQVFRMRLTPPQRKASAGSLLTDIGESLGYVVHQRGLLGLFLMMIMVSIAARPLQDFLPGFADRVFNGGAGGYALLTSSMGIGALIGAAWLAARGRTEGLVYIVILSGFGLAVAMFGFVATTRIWTGALFAALVGLTLTVMATGISALTQAAVSDGMRGRVMSLFSMIYRGFPAIGAVAIGILAETYGLRSTFAIASLLCLIIWGLAAVAHEAINAALKDVVR